MTLLRRSTRHRGCKHQENKNMAHHIGNKFVEFKVSKRVIDQISDKNNFECKVESNMLDQPNDVRKAELKPDVASSRLGKNIFGSGVIGLAPEVITIQVGENIATKVMSFYGNGWALCILSAHGVVSNVTLRHGTSSHETTIYEGYFDILSLSGSYQTSETNGMTSRTGGLSVSLAGLDGRLFGALTAASPVQVVIGRFPVEEKKKLKRAATSGIPGASGYSGMPGSSQN